MKKESCGVSCSSRDHPVKASVGMSVWHLSCTREPEPGKEGKGFSHHPLEDLSCNGFVSCVFFVFLVVRRVRHDDCGGSLLSWCGVELQVQKLNFAFAFFMLLLFAKNTIAVGEFF